MAESTWIGLDVGGANLKVADGGGGTISKPFALWRRPDRLADEIASTVALLGADGAAHVALTMTGELADCFADKAEGVRHIVRAAAEALPGSEIRVATVDDRWLPLQQAPRQTEIVAASNWRLLARHGASLLGDHPGLVIDAGSTTVDVVPVRSGVVVSSGATDTERLLAGELVYTGVRRTPVCALVQSLPYRGDNCSVAAELFATTADAWLLLGQVPESKECDTADGRPLEEPFSVARLARCVCADPSNFTREDAETAARAIAAAQIQRVEHAVRRALNRVEANRALLFGEGEFLVRLALEAMGYGGVALSFTEIAGAGPSACAPAHAAAVLASEELV